MFTSNPRPAGQDSDGKAKPPNQVEKICAVIVHLSALFWLPLMPMQALALVIPFIALQFARVHSEYVEQHAVQACNFQILMGCFYVVALLSMTLLHTTFLVWWVAAGASAFAMWEAAKAINGWPSKYPFTVKLFK